MKQIALILLVLLATVAFSRSHLPPAEAKITSPDLNVVLQSLERVEQENKAALAHAN
jgi:hypothetical protein